MPPPFMPSVGGVVMKSQLSTLAPLTMMKPRMMNNIVTITPLSTLNRPKATFCASILRAWLPCVDVFMSMFTCFWRKCIQR